MLQLQHTATWTFLCSIANLQNNISQLYENVFRSWKIGAGVRNCYDTGFILAGHFTFVFPIYTCKLYKPTRMPVKIYNQNEPMR